MEEQIKIMFGLFGKSITNLIDSERFTDRENDIEKQKVNDRRLKALPALPIKLPEIKK